MGLHIYQVSLWDYLEWNDAITNRPQDGLHVLLAFLPGYVQIGFWSQSANNYMLCNPVTQQMYILPDVYKWAQCPPIPSIDYLPETILHE